MNSVAQRKTETKVFEIATKMSKAGLPGEFIRSALDMAAKFEGVYDLLLLWDDEEDASEREHIIADIEGHIMDEQELSGSPKVIKRPKINFDDIESMGNDIVAFKKKLRQIVDANGGVPKLSEKIGMSKESLYRFFNSPAIPRKTTLYKISNALDLEEKDIAFEYTK